MGVIMVNIEWLKYYVKNVFTDELNDLTSIFIVLAVGLLKDLVTKLRPMLFLSGDYVCKKGDVGKEMFIVTTGQVQVVGGPDDSIVFVTLGKGMY